MNSHQFACVCYRLTYSKATETRTTWNSVSMRDFPVMSLSASSWEKLRWVNSASEKVVWPSTRPSRTALKMKQYWSYNRPHTHTRNGNGQRRRSRRIVCPCHRRVSRWVYSLILEEKILEQWSQGQVPRLLNGCASCLRTARLHTHTHNDRRLWHSIVELRELSPSSIGYSIGRHTYCRHAGLQKARQTDRQTYGNTQCTANNLDTYRLCRKMQNPVTTCIQNYKFSSVKV